MLVVLLALFSLVFANVASAMTNCCLKADSTNMPIEMMDEPCHELIDSNLVGGSLTDLPHDCQCDSCSQAGNTTQLERSSHLNSNEPAFRLFMHASVDPDRIDHPPKHIS